MINFSTWSLTSLVCLSCFSFPFVIINVLLDIQFYDHPLFSEEDLMASQLRLLYNQFSDRSKLDLWNFYTKKLHVQMSIFNL